MQFEKLPKQLALPLWMVFIFGYAINRAHHHALRLIKVAHAFRAFSGVYFVDRLAHSNCTVGALGLAHVTVDAFIGNNQGHVLF